MRPLSGTGSFYQRKLLLASSGPGAWLAGLASQGVQVSLSAHPQTQSQRGMTTIPSLWRQAGVELELSGS